MTPAAELRELGFILARGVLSPEEVDHYRRLLLERSGIDPEAWRSRGRGGQSWNHTDGVTQDPAFWDLILHPELLARVEAALGPGVRYLQHSDLQVGFSAVAWHRDNVNRRYGVGPDWDESDGPYGLVRVGIYLQSFAASGFRLGFIPGSHRLDAGTPPIRRRLREASFMAQGALAYLGPAFQQLTRTADWVATEPGDAVIFDPRILHSGSYIEGLKLSMFVGYGHPNRHFAALQHYYREVRTELGYRPLPAGLAARLEAAGRLPGELPTPNLEGAYLPNAPMRRLVARRVSRSR